MAEQYHLLDLFFQSTSLFDYLQPVVFNSIFLMNNQNLNKIPFVLINLINLLKYLHLQKYYVLQIFFCLILKSIFILFKNITQFKFNSPHFIYNIF